MQSKFCVLVLGSTALKGMSQSGARQSTSSSYYGSQPTSLRDGLRRPEQGSGQKRVDLVWDEMGGGGICRDDSGCVVRGVREGHSWELTEEFLFEKAELILNFPEGISAE